MTDQPQVHFHIRGNPLVPRGLAIAAYENEIVYFGAARNLDEDAVVMFAPNTVINMHPIDVEHLKGAMKNVKPIGTLVAK